MKMTGEQQDQWLKDRVKVVDGQTFVLLEPASDEEDQEIKYNILWVLACANGGGYGIPGVKWDLTVEYVNDPVYIMLVNNEYGEVLISNRPITKEAFKKACKEFGIGRDPEFVDQ